MSGGVFFFRVVSVECGKTFNENRFCILWLHTECVSVEVVAITRVAQHQHSFSCPHFDTDSFQGHIMRNPLLIFTMDLTKVFAFYIYITAHGGIIPKILLIRAFFISSGKRPEQLPEMKYNTYSDTEKIPDCNEVSHAGYNRAGYPLLQPIVVSIVYSKAL